MFSPSLHFMMSVAPTIPDPVTEAITEAPSSGLEMTVGEMAVGPDAYIRGYDEGDFGSITGTFDGGLVPIALITGPDNVLTIQFTGDHTTTLAGSTFEFGSSYGTHAVADASSTGYDVDSDTTTFTWSAFGQFVNAEVVTVSLNEEAASQALIGDATLATVEAEGALLGSYYIDGDATLATVEAEGAATNEDVTEEPPASLSIAAVGTAVTTNGVGSVDVPVPASAEEGDLLLMMVARGVAAGWELTPPTGWTTVEQHDVESANVWVMRKFASASEPASYNVPRGTTSGRSAGVMLRIVGHDATSPINASDIVKTNANGTSVEIPSVTTDAANCLLIGINSTSWASDPEDYYSSFGTMTEVIEVNTDGDGDGTLLGVAQEQLSASGATGTRTWTLARGLYRARVAIAIKPA